MRIIGYSYIRWCCVVVKQTSHSTNLRLYYSWRSSRARLLFTVFWKLPDRFDIVETRFFFSCRNALIKTTHTHIYICWNKVGLSTDTVCVVSNKPPPIPYGIHARVWSKKFDCLIVEKIVLESCRRFVKKNLCIQEEAILINVVYGFDLGEWNLRKVLK